MNPVEKRSVVITGCSSGIGYASVARMFESGWQVFATVRKTADADRLRSEFGSAVAPLTLDVTDRASIIAAAQQVSLQLQGDALQGRGLDGLVNVAGIGMARPVEYITESDLRKIFDINVFGQLAVIRAFLALLRRARGRIVNITSVGAHIAVPFGSLINASKSAFAMFSDTLRLELHPFGIHVTAIEPGAIRTPAVEKTLGKMEAVTDSLPEEGAAAYGPMLRNFAGRAYAREMNGSSPDVVARAVRRALTAPRPRTRYVVGKHARVLTTLPKVLPDRVLDQLLLRIAGMPTGFGSLAEPDEQKRRDAAADSPANTPSITRI